MSTSNDILTLCNEFTNALTEVLAENAVGPARRGRLARARAHVKKHPDYNEHAYFLALWKPHSRSGKPCKMWGAKTAAAKQGEKFRSLSRATPCHAG
jgi:hypothetical protein